MADAVTFTKPAARRIARAVKIVERLPQGHPPAGHRRQVTAYPRRIRFQLTATLTAGGSAAARILIFNSGTVSAIGGTITVYDMLGIFSGSSGDKGLAESWSDSGHWEIYQLACS